MSLARNSYVTLGSKTSCSDVFLGSTSIFEFQSSPLTVNTIITSEIAFDCELTNHFPARSLLTANTTIMYQKLCFHFIHDICCTLLHLMVNFISLVLQELNQPILISVIVSRTFLSACWLSTCINYFCQRFLITL